MGSRISNDDIAKRTIYSSETKRQENKCGHEAYAGEK